MVWNGQAWSAPEDIAPEQRYPGWSDSAITACDKIDPESALARTDALKETLNACHNIERYPEWPRAVISGSKLHLTWFTRSVNDLHDSDHASYQVWYSARQIDGAAVAPLALFTPVPTAAQPTTTPPPSPVPTPTLPPDIRSAPPVDGRLAWEGPGVLALGMAALSAAALLALAIGARLMLVRLRRRARG
jgi:hypothetical protein